MVLMYSSSMHANKSLRCFCFSSLKLLPIYLSLFHSICLYHLPVIVPFCLFYPFSTSVIIQKSFHLLLHHELTPDIFFKISQIHSPVPVRISPKHNWNRFYSIYRPFSMKWYPGSWKKIWCKESWVYCLIKRLILGNVIGNSQQFLNSSIQVHACGYKQWCHVLMLVIPGCSTLIYVHTCSGHWLLQFRQVKGEYQYQNNIKKMF